MKVTGNKCRVTSDMTNTSRITHHASRATHHACAAFTMVEIAISLAIIGFALVAIVGVLPLGMTVQKENREETIINQEATIWSEGIRNGAQGYDNLTNFVLGITNWWEEYDGATNHVGAVGRFDGYDRFGSTTNPNFPLTNGFRIIGLLTMPKYVARANGDGFYSNHIVAYVQAMSGAAADKFPQDNKTIRDAAFSYRMISELVPYVWIDPDSTNYTAYLAGSADQINRSNHWMFARNLSANLYDLRLTFRWPLLPNGNTGNGRHSFRTMLSGQRTNYNDSGQQLLFFQPSTYAKAP
jgi:hypothetical protein